MDGIQFLMDGIQFLTDGIQFLMDGLASRTFYRMVLLGIYFSKFLPTSVTDGYEPINNITVIASTSVHLLSMEHQIGLNKLIEAE